MSLTRRTFVAAGLAAAPLFAGTHKPAHAVPGRVAGVYQQITPDGTFINPRYGGVHGLLAYGALVDVFGSAAHHATFEAILNWLKRARPPFITPEVGVYILCSPFMRSHQAVSADLHSYVDGLLSTMERDPDSLLNSGQIRDLAGRAELLTTYATHLEEQWSGRTAKGDHRRLISRIDDAATTLLDRLVELQFTRPVAVEKLGNIRWTGAFPHIVDAGSGNMSTFDVSNWSPEMLSLNHYRATRALACGFGRFHRASYNRAAAAASRIILASTKIDPDLIYAGLPTGFPLDGAQFSLDDEGGEHLYLITYGWSPNGIAEIGSTADLLHRNQVTIPRSKGWAERYWTGTPMESALNSTSYRAGLRAKVDHAHKFLNATQLPVPADFPWIDLDRTTYPSGGDDEIRRGGWFDGSGRGTMSASYSQIALSAYIETGGRDQDLLLRAATWWDRMVVWES